MGYLPLFPSTALQQQKKQLTKKRKKNEAHLSDFSHLPIQLRLQLFRMEEEENISLHKVAFRQSLFLGNEIKDWFVCHLLLGERYDLGNLHGVVWSNLHR